MNLVLSTQTWFMVNCKCGFYAAFFPTMTQTCYGFVWITCVLSALRSSLGLYLRGSVTTVKHLLSESRKLASKFILPSTFKLSETHQPIYNYKKDLSKSTINSFGFNFLPQFFNWPQNIANISFVSYFH